ncbi:MAG: LysR substrate-binding domain-containing protein [Dokdonella sp.]|uniref:LysR substrate-binding domain-containing protein n=1 Tax=Dokdonella sp. TaxID=2291710 RepID=UPI003264725B
MKDLPLNALRAFALACSKGGVRAAARELGVAHSSVSRHLTELEAWLGLAVVDRDRDTAWAPTQQGGALGQKILSHLQAIDAEIAAVREQRSPFSLTMTVAPSFASRWLLPRLPALERAHPRIELSVLVSQQLDALNEGIDLAVRMGAGAWPGVDCEPLMDDVLYPVMSPALWKEARQSRDVSSLRTLRLLHDRDPLASWEHWRTQFGPASIDLKKGPRLASSDLVLRAAELGQGVALARGRLAADALESGALIRPFGMREVRLTDAYWIVRPKGDALRSTRRRTVETVIRWLRDQV